MNYEINNHSFQSCYCSPNPMDCSQENRVWNSRRELAGHNLDQTISQLHSSTLGIVCPMKMSPLHLRSASRVVSTDFGRTLCILNRCGCVCNKDYSWKEEDSISQHSFRPISTPDWMMVMMSLNKLGPVFLWIQMRNVRTLFLKRLQFIGIHETSDSTQLTAVVIAAVSLVCFNRSF